MEIQWLGHPAFRIETETGIVIFIDPWITGNPVCPITLADVDQADVICVTHGHEDHLGDALELVRNMGAHLICSPEVGKYADRHGIPYGKGSTPINIGGCTTYRGMTFHGTHSVHTSGLYGKEWFDQKDFFPNGTAMGFVIELENGLRMYHAGDTGLTMDMKIIGEVYHPDIAMLPIGGRYTMTPELAAIAAQWIGAPVVIPMHYNTFEFNRQDVDHYRQLVENLAKGIKVVKLAPGDVYAVPDNSTKPVQSIGKE